MTKDEDDVTEAMLVAGRAAWQSAIKDRNLDQWLAHMYLAMRAADPSTAVEMEICDACNGAGGDNQHTICGKCGGSGGYPASSTAEKLELVEQLTAILTERRLPGTRNGPITEPRELAEYIAAKIDGSEQG